MILAPVLTDAPAIPAVTPPRYDGAWLPWLEPVPLNPPDEPPLTFDEWYATCEKMLVEFFDSALDFALSPVGSAAEARGKAATETNRDALLAHLRRRITA